MIARVFIKPKKGVLDPQGKAVHGALGKLGFDQVREVRVGKYIEIRLDTDDRDAARSGVQKMCDTLLVNRVIEDFTFEIAES
ncbi:MAG: phosphoribosylformylglycinamidine synthase subunit PurS [Deltaproteobacteria bacterium]|nr:phosphoribosylformylglycinamidine synthase subunit PurS [Deltaproteobacteria bacterium]